jgi:hypothetical protein
VLGFNATETGILGALEAIVNIPSKIIGGLTSDHLQSVIFGTILIGFHSFFGNLKQRKLKISI